MKIKRILYPLVMLILLMAQFLPGTVFSPSPVAAVTLCDQGQFVSDVTIPDGTSVTGGSPMVKVWRIKNIGTCTWTTSYSAVFYSGSQMGAPVSVNLPSSVAPGATVDITVNMTAPLTPGRYIGYWKLRNASGTIFGLGINSAYAYLIDINVPATYSTAYDFVANAASATWTSGAGALTYPVADGAASGFVFKSDTPQLETGANDTKPGLIVGPQNITDGFISGVYPAFTVQSTDRFQATLSCAYGVTTCYVTFRLDYQIDSGPIKTLWSFREKTEGMIYNADVSLASLAGQNVKFILTVTASGSPTGDRVVWGGAKIARGSGPVPTAGPSPTPAPSMCNKAEFVADVTIPDGTTLTSGAAFTKTWRIKNTGSCTWTTSYSLIFLAGDKLGAPTTVAFPSSVAPGSTVDLSVNMVAPTAVGHYRSYWRMRDGSGNVFGTTAGAFFADIYVATTTYTTAYDFAANACLATWSSAAGVLPCPGTDGNASGFVLKLDAPKLEDGTTGAAGLLTFPQNIYDGYIQGLYPAFLVQNGDRFQSIINCQYGATGCYVTFQLNYQIGGGPIYTLKSFSEKIEGQYYRLDIDLSSLAGQNVNFILKVKAAGYPTGDRAVWSGPRIARTGGSVPTSSPSLTPTPTATLTPTISGPTVTVYYLDTNRYAALTTPYEVGVSRAASDTLSDPEAVLAYLLEGPTAPEQATGLTVVLSGTTGYSSFTVSGTVAHVYLTGTCASGGATYTIADLINVNLKQFAGIDYVKIYDEFGNTQTPAGDVDSIPLCLEP